MAKQKKFIWTIFQAIDLLRKSEDKNIKIEITRWKPKRSLNQNNYFHLILDMIWDEIWEDREYMKDLMKQKFLMQDSKLWQVPWRTSKLDEWEMAKFTEKIIIFAWSELNMRLPTPDEYRRWEHFENILLTN